jgi:hypothetical protein
LIYFHFHRTPAVDLQHEIRHSSVLFDRRHEGPRQHLVLQGLLHQVLVARVLPQRPARVRALDQQLDPKVLLEWREKQGAARAQHVVAEGFKSYLQMIGKKHCWEEKIYPQIKKNLLAIVLASLEDTDLELNTFELNGADLLIGYDFEPILLEINATPDLNCTTKTTNDICPRVMEDLIRGESVSNDCELFLS